MSGSDDMNNLDRGAAGGKSSKDSKKNLQGLLRRRYQQSRGSFRSDSNDENPSPVPEPVSFRPPARQSVKSSAPPSGARGGMDDEKRDANGNIIFENNFDLPPQNEDRSQSRKGHGQGQFKAQGQMTSQGQSKFQGHYKSDRRPEKKGQLDSALSTVINEISSDSGRGARSKQSDDGTVFENNFDDLDLEPSAGAGARGQPFTSRGRMTPGASNSGHGKTDRRPDKKGQLDSALSTVINEISSDSGRGTRSKQSDGGTVFENNFDDLDLEPSAGAGARGQPFTSRGRMTPGASNSGQRQMKAEGQMTSQGQSKSQGHGKTDRRPEKKGQLDSALSTVINEISSDSGRGARSKQSDGGTVFENNFDDLDLEPSAGAGARGQPFTSRGGLTPGASNSAGDVQAETERQQRLEKLRRPREIKENKDDKIFKMLQTSGNQDGVGNEKMGGSDQAAGGVQGRAMTEEEENEQFLSQALFAPAKKKKGNSKAAQQYNELMQRRLVGDRENADKAKKPERKLLDEDDKGGAKDPLTEMMNALSSLGGEGGGYQNGGGNQNRPDPMAQLLQNLGDMKAEKNDNQQPGQGGADPFAQLLGGLGGGMGNGGGEMMQQERQRNGDPMAQMMAMMGGGRGQRNGGGGGGGLGQMLGGEGNGGGGGLGQLLGGLGGMGGQQGEGDEMAQIAAMMGGGRGRGLGQGGGLGQMLGGVGGGQQEGGDEMAQLAAIMGGGRGRGQGQGGGLGQMLGGVGGGQQEGGDEMAQLAAIMGGGRGRGHQNAGGGGIAQMLGGLGGMGGGENGGEEIAQLAAMMGAGGGQGMDPMSQMMAAFGGGGRGRGAAGDPMSQMMAMFGGGQMPGQGRGRGHGGQGEEEDINIENASLNDQIQQLLGYESLKARNNKSPKSDGMCTVIIIDTSGSMHGAPMTSVGDFISQFLNGLEEVQFEYALEENVAIVSVGREVHVVQHLTTDYGEVRRAVDTIYADGPSPLHLGLMIPLSILQLDLQQRRDYIANSNGHRICPRVIFITDGHPSTQEDTPGRSAPANEQESLTLQGICVELFQTVRDRTLCELYAVPVGDANQAFLQNLSESTGGGIRVPGEAKQMSRAYLHHHIVGNLKCSGHDITNRDVVAQVVQQIMACSDESDVDSVMKLIAQGEPDTQKRDQELQAQLQQAGRGRGGGGGGDGMAGGYQQMMQALLGGEMGGGRGGGRGEGMIRPVGGRGRAPLMGESRGMEAMMQSMRGRVPGVGGVAHRQQGAPNLFDDGLGGRVPGFGDSAQNRPSAPDIDLSAFGANGGVSDEEFGARIKAKIEHARKGGKPKPEWQVIGGLGRGEEVKGGEEPIRLFGEGQQGQEDKQAKNGAAEAKQEKKKEDANAGENPPVNENAGNRVLTEEEIMRLMPQGGDNESVLGLSDSDNPAMTPEFVELLMTENDLEKRGFLSTLRNGRKARTEEEKRQRSLEKVMCAEKVGVNEPNSSDEDEEMGEPENVPKRPEYTAQRDINSKLREALRKRDEKKQRAKAENRENEARNLGNQNDGNHLAQLFGGLNGQEADEVRHNVGRPYEPEPGLGRRVGGHGLPRGIPDLGFRRGRGGFPADYPGMGGNPEDRPPSSPPKHNLPDDIAALMQLDKKAERSKPGKPHGAQPGLVYKYKQGQGGASGSSQPAGRNTRPIQTTHQGLEGLGLITDEDTDGDIEMGTASPRDTPHVEVDRSRSGHAAAASARRPAQNRGNIVDKSPHQGLEGLGLITDEDTDGDIEMGTASPRDTPHVEVAASRWRPAQNRELRELLQQRQQRNARQSRTSNGRPTLRHTDTESDN